MKKFWQGKSNRLRPRTEARHLISGRWGEKQAERFLKKNHHKIIGRRVRAGKRGELDLISRRDGVLIFIEVKTRRNEAFGRPFAAVNAAKRKQLCRAAVAYMKKQNIKPEFIRFDVVEVIGEPGGGKPEIRHIENAFPLDSSLRLWW